MRELFDEMIRDFIKPYFKEMNYKKSALNFTKSEHGFVYHINFQKGHGNTYRETRFYINCGIYSPEFVKVIGGQVAEKPKEYECQYRSRVEPLEQLGKG